MAKAGADAATGAVVKAGARWVVLTRAGASRVVMARAKVVPK